MAAPPCAHLLVTTDWSSLPVGPPSAWPPELRASFLTALQAPPGILITVGPQLHMLYNDAYASFIGSKHPSAFGRPFFESFREIEAVFGADYRAIFLEGKIYQAEERGVVLERAGSLPEECSFTWTGSPLMDGNNNRIGNFYIVDDCTKEVKMRRRLEALRGLTDSASNASDSVMEVMGRRCLDVLEKCRKDIPCAALYLTRGDEAVLISSFGFDQSDDVRQRTLATRIARSAADNPWRIPECLKSSSVQLIHDLVAKFGVITMEPWQRPPTTARVFPLSLSGNNPIGVVILGENSVLEKPGRGRDDALYFVQAVVQGLANALSSAKAIEVERQRLAELQELNEAKSTFLTSVSHEFRTPLTLILAPIEDLIARAAELHLSNMVTESLTLVQQSAVRLLYMVNSLLEFSASEARALKAEYQCIDLKTFVTEILAQFEHAIQCANLRLTMKLDEVVPSVWLDKGMWEKIVVNLLANAIKYTRPGGDIEVSITAPPQQQRLLFSVRDTGIGIPAEDLPHIFDRFYRAKRQGLQAEGTGIGLALVKELVQTLGGAVEVSSVADRGSKFTVSLRLGRDHISGGGSGQPAPMAPQRAAPSPYVKQAAIVSSLTAAKRRSGESVPTEKPTLAITATVLACDDNEQMLHYVGSVLSAAGFVVYFARNGREALARLRAKPSQNIDLVLSDVMMPVMDGISMLKALRADSSIADLPVVLMSARGAEQSRLAGIADGADDYLVKPFSSAELVTRVRSAIELYKTRRMLMAERETSLAKDKFVAVLSHELRNPLSVVLLLAEALSGDTVLPETARESARLIQANVGAEVALIDDLLDCAQLACGTLRVELVAADVVALLRDTIRSVQPEFQRGRVEIVEKVAHRATAMVDSVRLTQVFKKLLDNAVRATPEGGRVTISACASDDKQTLSISIQDTGIGIAPALLPHVAQRFFAASAQVSDTPGGGLGLGLFLSKSLLELMHGTIEINSEGPGRGTTVSITLPLPIQGDQTPAISPATRRLHKRGRTDDEDPMSSDVSVHKNTRFFFPGLRVLLVEDNPSTLLIMQRLLSDVLHCVVTSAVCQRDALQIVRNKQFDVLLSDIGLPDGNGWDLMRQVQHLQPSLVGIAITGFGTDADVAKTYEAGFLRHMTKPIRLASLRNALLETVVPMHSTATTASSVE